MPKEIIITGNEFKKIISKAGDVEAIDFKTIDKKAIAEISNWMPEVNRAVSAFNKRNSQTTASLMQLNMVDAGPYRMLRQILAQVEKKRAALKEVIYKTELRKIEYRELISKIEENEISEFKKELFQLKQNKVGCDIIDSQGHIEAALKELGALKRRYEEICRNKNIPEKWDEEDFENAEVEHHIKSIFRNALRDQLQGNCNVGTMEYMEQFGINPITAYAQVRQYVSDVNKIIQEKGIGPSIESHYQFYNSMFEVYKDSYKKAMRNIGLDSITQADFLMKEKV